MRSTYLSEVEGSIPSRSASPTEPSELREARGPPPPEKEPEDMEQILEDQVERVWLCEDGGVEAFLRDADPEMRQLLAESNIQLIKDMSKFVGLAIALCKHFTQHVQSHSEPFSEAGVLELIPQLLMIRSFIGNAVDNNQAFRELTERMQSLLLFCQRMVDSQYHGTQCILQHLNNTVDGTDFQRWYVKSRDEWRQKADTPDGKEMLKKGEPLIKFDEVGFHKNRWCEVCPGEAEFPLGLWGGPDISTMIFEERELRAFALRLQ
ncbi:hypothetical protein PQX77_021174, partial [Marasmius sp. AFHP31]